MVKFFIHCFMKSSGKNSCSRAVPACVIPPAENLHATGRHSSQHHYLSVCLHITSRAGAIATSILNIVQAFPE